jgi:hypothetical protein
VVGLGFLGYVLYRIGVWLGEAVEWSWRRTREAYHGRVTFTADDDPIMALIRLARLRQGTFLPRFDLGQPGHPAPVFQLEPPARGRDHRWVAPGIVYRWTLEHSTLSEERKQRLRNDLTMTIDDRRAPGTVARLLASGFKHNALTYRWATAANLDRPAEIEVTRLQQRMPPLDLVTEEGEDEEGI